MSDERLIMAIGRLERALSRAEASGGELANNAKSANIGTNDDNIAYQELEKKHKELKQLVNVSLSAINNILDKGQDHHG